MPDLENEITYKFNGGFYSLQDLIILVKYNNMTPDQFFKTTGVKYDVYVSDWSDDVAGQPASQSDVSGA